MQSNKVNWEEMEKRDFLKTTSKETRITQGVSLVSHRYVLECNERQKVQISRQLICTFVNITYQVVHHRFKLNKYVPSDLLYQLGIAWRTQTQSTGYRQKLSIDFPHKFNSLTSCFIPCTNIFETLMECTSGTHAQSRWY